MRARPVFNSPVFITRRVAQQRFRLLPTKKTTQILTYLLAVLTERYDILVHAVCAMSNHLHSPMSDPKRNIADFTRDFHSLVARHINAGYGDRESLFSSTQTSHVRPETSEDLLRQIAYTAANPTKAGLVMYGHRWPGLRGAFGDKPITVKRPAGFLRNIEDADGNAFWPEVATLRFARPPGFDELSAIDLAGRVQAMIEEAEAKARADVLGAGRSFLGVKGVLRQARWARPSTREPLGRISPRVACQDKWRRIERLQANKLWLADYENSRDRFAAGERDVVFPFGTHQMKRRHNVNVAPNAPPS